jgi:hypothetical protein
MTICDGHLQTLFVIKLMGGGMRNDSQAIYPSFHMGGDPAAQVEVIGDFFELPGGKARQ